MIPVTTYRMTMCNNGSHMPIVGTWGIFLVVLLDNQGAHRGVRICVPCSYLAMAMAQGILRRFSGGYCGLLSPVGYLALAGPSQMVLAFYRAPESIPRLAWRRRFPGPEVHRGRVH
jgi:hypothetical protein